MRRWAQLVCVLLGVSFVLAPLSHVHAHVTGDAHERMNVHVHGGYDHDVVDHHHDVHDHHGENGDRHSPHEHDSSPRVLDMQPDVSQRNSDAFDVLHWIAVAFVLLLVLFERLPIRLKLPRRIRTRPPSPYPHALPLLRGPPCSI